MLKIEEIYDHYQDYLYVIEKNLEYLKKDFSNLSKNEIYKFKYINNILLNDDTIDKKSTLDNIKNFMEGKPVENVEDLKEVIEKRNKVEDTKLELKKTTFIEYNIGFNSDYIEYIISEKTKIDRKDYSDKHTKIYNYKMFNKNIIKLIESVNLENFENELFKNILPEYDYSCSFYEKEKPIIFKIISSILKSKAAKDFFEEHYMKKYNTNERRIEYHFDKDEVINEIFNRIDFYPLFDSTTKAYTNPSDLSIQINNIPGKFESDVNYFNKKILQIGRIVVFAIHEIFGHFLRRYYSYLTKGVIEMDTNDDNLINTKPEGGFFVEKYFLGLDNRAHLFLKDALFFFLYGDNLENYPIIKNNVDLSNEVLKIIIDKNKEIFDFIKNEDEKDEKKEEIENKEGEAVLEDEQNDEEYEEDEEDDSKDQIIKKKNNKITLEQYYNFLHPVKKKIPSIIACGYRRGEKYIIL